MASVPAGTVKVAQLLDGRPRSVGMRVTSGDFEDEALARGMEAPVGVVITHVVPNSAAAAAGFRVGDVIEQMGDHQAR
jgi:S1-C subfamily serine protease